MNTELTKLGGNIRSARRNHGISQERLAEFCDLHRTYICDIERGARNVSFLTLSKIARGLRMTLSELLSGVDILMDQGDPRISSRFNLAAASTPVVDHAMVLNRLT